MLAILNLLLVSAVRASEQKIAYLAHTSNYWQVWTMLPDGSQKQQITSSKYDKTHVSWYPDGIHLLVNGAQGWIFKINTVTRNETKIELPIKGTLDAVISPDGKKIAFSLTVAGSRDNNHIWLVNGDGRNLRRLTNMGGLQHEPVWSPDEQWIYFLSSTSKEDHDIFRVSTLTSSIEQLTVDKIYNFDVAISNNGEMAFSSNRQDNYEIWIQEANGNVHRLTHNKAIDSRPSWSPDGKVIVFESSRNGPMNIWRMSVDDKLPIQLTNEKIGARYPVWSKTSGNKL